MAKDLAIAGYGLASTHVPDDLEALAKTADIVLLDFTPPADRAIVALRKVAESSIVPIVAFSATSDLISAIEALDLGADDLLTASFTAEELTARIRSIVRRQGRSPKRSPRLLVGGPLALDEDERLLDAHGHKVALTSLQCRLLSYFLRHPGEPLSRARLLADVWGYTVGATSTVTVHVRRLREMVEQDPSDPTLIRTVWGVGYRFTPTSPG